MRPGGPRCSPRIQILRTLVAAVGPLDDEPGLMLPWLQGPRAAYVVSSYSCVLSKPDLAVFIEP